MKVPTGIFPVWLVFIVTVLVDGAVVAKSVVAVKAIHVEDPTPEVSTEAAKIPESAATFPLVPTYMSRFPDVDVVDPDIHATADCPCMYDTDFPLTITAIPNHLSTV